MTRSTRFIGVPPCSSSSLRPPLPRSARPPPPRAAGARAGSPSDRATARGPSRWSDRGARPPRPRPLVGILQRLLCFAPSSLLGELPMSAQLTWSLVSASDHALGGDDLGRLGVARAERHLHRLHERLADVAHDLAAGRVAVGIEPERRRTARARPRRAFWVCSRYSSHSSRRSSFCTHWSAVV